MTPTWVPVTLSIPKAARVLHISERTLRHWAKSGTLHAPNVGYHGSRHVPVSEIERLAQRLTRTPDWNAIADIAEATRPPPKAR